MQLLMFSGNSLRNRDFIREAQKQLADDFDGSYIQEYQHWEIDSNANINMPHELEVLKAHIADVGDEYGVFAKSIGTALTVHAIEQGIIKPKFMLLCGLPLGYIEVAYPQFAQVLADSQIPVTIIHNEHDKVGSADAVQAYLSPAMANRANYQFVVTPGDTHDYEDYGLLRAELAKLR